MGCLLYDPINIRYATDVANMQVWSLHNFTRYVFVATDGPVVLFDYAQAKHLGADFPLVDEIRPATAWFYMYAGSAEAEQRGAGLGAGDRRSGYDPWRREPPARGRQVRATGHRHVARRGGRGYRQPGVLRGGAQDQAPRRAQGDTPGGQQL